jgi:hypothetical protein
MAYKFQRGVFRASGSTVIEEGLTIDASGLTVTGSSNVQALTANSLNVDSVSLDANILSGLSQLTSSNSSLGVAVATSFDISAGTLTLADGQIGAAKVGGGTFNAGTFSFLGSTISSLGTVTTADINGGTIDGTNIGASTQGTGQFTTLSASSNLQVGTSVTASTGVRVNAGGVIVTAGGLAVNGGDLNVSPGNLTVGGITNLNGNIFLGDAGADTISFNGQVSSSIFPSVTSAFNLGSSGNLWSNIRGVVLSASNQIFAGTSITAQTLTASVGATLGATVVSTITGSGAATFASLTVDSVDINGGAIDGTTIGGTAQSSVKATTLSASSNLQVGTSITASSGILVNAGGLTVSAGDSSLQKLTVNGDLIVLGTTFSASVGTLVIEDKQIVLADGAPNAAAAYGAGFFVSGANVEWTFKENGEGTAASSGHIFAASSSAGLIDIQAANFYGTFVGTMASAVTPIADENKTLEVGVNYGTTNLATVSRTWTLPASAGLTAGQSVRVKAPAGLTSTRTIIVSGSGAQTIDGETTIVLESDYAAVELVYVTTDTWRVF